VTRRPAFWIVFAFLGVGGAVTGVRLFSDALPTVALDITLDRGEALARAAELAGEYGWGAPDDRSAASFGLVDDEVQTYVELEGGGRDVFAGLSGRGLYEPFQWRVRRFAEHRVEEVLVSFTPTGDPYGFRLRLSEEEAAGGNLDGPAARSLAESTAQDWGVDIGAYRLLDSSQETLPGGRLDHHLVYERAGEAVAEGRFRLRLGVSGSRPSELTHTVFVPEAFSRRYDDMRSTNDAIALVSQALFMLVFVVLGAGVGSALLLRRRWLEWRAPLAWGAVIAFVFGLNNVNQMPLSWMSYDTALSSSNFVLQQLGSAAAIGLLGTPLIAFFLMAGESLGRRAFGHHLQQWRFWSPQVASSTTALGMTTAAYLLLGLQLGYVMLFYLGTQRLEGWWSPADALVQPDLLATYLPWLQAVSLALFAAFWEESIFRAVPIACAALLGARFGRRGLWIAISVVGQALVFAAAHANYAQQPPYARVVELTGPALLWGLVYLRFGLVPTILTHFLYDLSLISVVLFESRALVDQGVIIVAGLVPLGVVLVSRVRAGARPRPPEWAFNGAWSPRTAASPPAVVDEPPTDRAAPSPARADASRKWRWPGWVVPTAGVLGALLWVGARLSHDPPPPLWGDAEAAVAAAHAALRAEGAPVDTWSSERTAGAGPNEGRDYVFEEAGAEAYAQLRGTYVDAPRWVVRLVDWRGDPEARVEEYRAWVGDSGRVIRTYHAVPEGRAGPSLDGDAARELATSAATTRLGLTRERLREVEAEESSLPGRTDWTFTFTELGLLEDVDGEARVEVRIAGDEVVDVSRELRVPEAWVRERREVESRRLIMGGGLLLLLVVGLVAAAVGGVVAWSRGTLARGVVVRLALPVAAAMALSEANAWPTSVTAFSTAQPWAFQAGALALALLLAAVVAAPGIGFVGALAATWLSPGRVRAPRGAAVALGVLLAGLIAGARAVFPSAPRLPDYSGAGAFVPFLDAPLRAVTPYLLLTSGLLVVLAVIERGRRRQLVRSVVTTVLAVSAVVLVPPTLQASLPVWAVAALGNAVVLFGGMRVLSNDPLLVPGLVGTVTALDSVGFALDAPHVGARLGGVLAALTVGALAWSGTRLLARLSERPPSPSQSAEETRASVGSL